jgi:hypothetical protein
MAKTCFFKEIASNQFYVGGAPVQFESLPGNRGIIALESPKDDVIIAALSKAASEHVQGVSMISEDQMAEKKSLANSIPLPPPRAKEMLRPMPKGPFERKAPTAAPASQVSRDALPLTNSALREAAGISAPPPPPAAAPVPQMAESSPVTPEEGFRPATRRISRKPVTA